MIPPASPSSPDTRQASNPPAGQPSSQTPQALIIGCGYLGRVLAQMLIQNSQTVHGSTRSTDHAAALAQQHIKPLLLDVTQPVTFAAIRPLLDGRPLHVYYLVPPGQPTADTTPRQVILDGIANTTAALCQGNVRRAILTSSTAVYSPDDGSTVSADSPATPSTPRGRLLLQGENLWLSAGPAYHVLRLSGLYGPHRIIGLAAVQQRAPLVGNPHATLNLIHVNDAATLLIAMMNSPNTARIELGSDGQTRSRISYYTELAKQLHQPPPQILDDAAAARQLGIDTTQLRTAGNKRCDPGPTSTRTGWRPRHTNCCAALADAIASLPPPDAPTLTLPLHS